MFGLTPSAVYHPLSAHFRGGGGDSAFILEID